MEHNAICPIWETRATLIRGSMRNDAAFHSDRTSGRYGISQEAAGEVARLSPAQRSILTTWLVDQRRAGVLTPIIQTEVLERVLARRPLRFSERIERFFLYLSVIGFNPASRIVLADDFPEVEMPFHPQHMMAWIEARSFDEGHKFLTLLLEQGYFQQIPFGSGHLILTANGFSKLEEIELGAADTLQAFVAMWFDDSMKEAWWLGLEPGIRDAGYRPFRIDGLQHNGKIDDAIVAEIKKSRFLIADFTCPEHKVEGAPKPKGEPRGGVYYEAGLAHGLGMEVIFTCRADRMDHLHFDTRQFAHIVWQSPDDLRLQLYNRIAATLKEAPGAPGRGKAPLVPKEVRAS